MNAETKTEPPVARTMHEVARQTGLSYQTIYRAVKSGSLPARQCGRRILVTHEDLVSWLNKMPAVQASVA